MISFSACPLCSGQVGFRVCTTTDFMVLLCDQCGFVWVHPSEIIASNALDPLTPDFARRHPDCILRPGHWATTEEVEARGWGVYLLDPGHFHPQES